jgi:hypothetical protein
MSCSRVWPSCRSSSSSSPSSSRASSTVSSLRARLEVRFLGVTRGEQVLTPSCRSRRTQFATDTQSGRRLSSGYPHLHQCVAPGPWPADVDGRGAVALTYSVIAPLILCFATIYLCVSRHPSETLLSGRQWPRLPRLQVQAALRVLCADPLDCYHLARPMRAQTARTRAEDKPGQSPLFASPLACSSSRCGPVLNRGTEA